VSSQSFNHLSFLPLFSESAAFSTDSQVTLAPPVCAGSNVAKKIPTILGKNDLSNEKEGQHSRAHLSSSSSSSSFSLLSSPPASRVAFDSNMSCFLVLTDLPQLPSLQFLNARTLRFGVQQPWEDEDGESESEIERKLARSCRSIEEKENELPIGQARCTVVDDREGAQEEALRTWSDGRRRKDGAEGDGWGERNEEVSLIVEKGKRGRSQ